MERSAVPPSYNSNRKSLEYSQYTHGLDKFISASAYIILLIILIQYTNIHGGVNCEDVEQSIMHHDVNKPIFTSLSLM